LNVYWNLVEAVPIQDCLTAQDWLSDGEKQRLGSLCFPRRRDEWLLGRCAAKMLLLESLISLNGTEPTALSIENEPEGAPCVHLNGRKLNLSLSISHRDRLAFCALSESNGCTLGADIEKVESRLEVFVADFFTGAEQSQLDGVSGLERDRLITLIWSAKESALKALRKGLRVDTRTVEIHGIASAAGSWGSFAVSSAQTTKAAWRGWWQLCGEYVLTIALLAPVEMVENTSLVQNRAGRLEKDYSGFPVFLRHARIRCIEKTCI